jgi:hypothetical protein
MKKMIFLATILVSFFATTLMANDGEKISKSAKIAFEKEFPHAEYTSWSRIKKHDLYLVRFVQYQEPTIAYIDDRGNIAGVARNASTDELPRTVQKAIKKKYPVSQTLSIDELTIDDEPSYLFTIDQEKTRLYVRVYSNGTIEELKKEKRQ